jgi:hypothetical protein
VGPGICDALGPAGTIPGRIRRLIDQKAAAVAPLKRAVRLAGRLWAQIHHPP